MGQINSTSGTWMYVTEAKLVKNASGRNFSFQSTYFKSIFGFQYCFEQISSQVDAILLLFDTNKWPISKKFT